MSPGVSGNDAGAPVDLVCRVGVVAEVRAAFERYEAALVAGDAATMGELFWGGEEIVRFGIADAQHGASELAAYRVAQPPPRPGRTLSGTVVATYGDDVAVVSTSFSYPGRDLLGRQQQTWVRIEGRWRIVAAHVSEIPRPAVGS